MRSPGDLLSLIRDGAAVTRADLARHTGLARSTVAQRVDALLTSGLVVEAGGSTSTGGRPPTVLAFNHRAGVVLVDNDVNIMARGEHWVHWRGTSHLLLVKVGTGIGCGIVEDGHIHRGARGAAGDIGHIRATGEHVVCACGNIGCLEAVAGGHALAMRLAASGVEASNSRDVVRLVHEGNVPATQMVRAAGRTLGEVLAGTVNFFNPAVIVIGGDIAEAHAQLLAGVREGIFSRSLPLATRDLRIVPCRLGDRAGVTGAAITAIEQVLSPAAVDQTLQTAAA
jgi:predicted NBD/HSP70 family sugar kinase